MLFYGALGLVAMAAGAAAFALVALPADFVRDHAIAAVKERTGRDLVIAGPTSFTFFPSLGVSLTDVSLSGAPGLEGARPLVAMKAMDLSVAFWPLLGREVRVNALVLREPVFHLEVDGSGRRSWDFASDTYRTRVRLAQADAPVSDAPQNVSGGDAASLRLSDLRLDNVSIDNGTLRYSDARTGSESEFSAINVKLALAALAEPLDAEGSLAWKGKTVSFDGALTSLVDVIEDRPAKLKLTFGADVLDATFEGSATLKDALGVEGILSAKSPSARALFAWLGTDLAPSAGFGPMDAKGLWRAKPDQYTFTTAEIELDQTTARGEISLDTRGARPLVNANLKLTELDLNTYKSTGEARSAPPAASEADGNARSIEDLLERATPPGPRVKGFTKREGWSEEPFDLAHLGALDANAKLSIGKLTVGTIRLDQSDLTIALKNRFMTTTLDQVALYQGTGKGTITLDGTADSAAGLDADITLDGIAAQPLLKDAVDIDRLAGTGRLALTLTGRGANERELVETLNGRVELAFANGAIIGVNIPEMMRNLAKGNLGGLDTAPTDKTDFSEMTSNWSVKSGIAENQDLMLVSPLLRLSGSGQVALASREVDYVLRPKVVASLAGQGGAQDLLGIEVPVRVHGPWDDPKYTPDVAGALNNPKTVEAIKEIGKQFKGKKADELVKDLLSGDSKSRKEKGKKLLEQFLSPQ
ncbi:AsmA family protein [Hyphomicrobium sp.]|uniref:AsmA family protein n=1 Tax=Hyphomicrobium sp. TaxID=82 RepID=UPI0025C394A0|nr:AsmA family protein [Hyphomicrobium sp.]MCC7251691.1 AsmA family protein [Hyphomicrobium sp.]